MIFDASHRLALALLALALPTPPALAQCDPDLARVTFTGPLLDTIDFGFVADMNASGDVVFFAAPSVASFAGAVRAWRHDGTAWIATPLIAPAGLQPEDHFGRSLAVDAVGDTLLVGAPHSTFSSGEGRAYVLQLVGTTWTVEATLAASDAAQQSGFGQTCDLDASGTVAVVAGRSGGAYVFRRSGAAWVEEQIIDPGPAQYVALSPDGQRIGFRERVFRHDGAQWVLDGTLVASGGYDVAARSFDAAGRVLLASAVGDGEPTLFRRDAGGWSEEQQLVVPPGLLNLTGPLALDAHGEVAYVRGFLADGSAWAVSPFRFDGVTWNPEALLVADYEGEGLGGGIALSADASRIAIGASGLPTATAGFYSFRCASQSAFCFGTACPCGNDGLVGRGCDNAAATGGVRLAAQAFAPSAGTVELVASGAPAATAPTVLLLRDASSSAAGAPFFDGLLCLGAAPARVAAAAASGGEARFALVHDAGAGTFHYQALYRSKRGGFCTAGAANLSNGLTLGWP